MKAHQTVPVSATRSAPHAERGHAREAPAPAARTHRTEGARSDLPVHDLSRMSIGPQSRTEPHLSGFARLPHEAWHVAQQTQGRAKPTLQMKGNAINNDNSALEREADEMASPSRQFHAPAAGPVARQTPVIQRLFDPDPKWNRQITADDIGDEKNQDTLERWLALPDEDAAPQTAHDNAALRQQITDHLAFLREVPPMPQPATNENASEDEVESESDDQRAETSGYDADSDTSESRSESDVDNLRNVYRNWDPEQRTAIPVQTPYGAVSAQHKRNAPWIRSKAADYSNKAMKTDYNDFLRHLAKNKNDAAIAKSLLSLDDTAIENDFQRRAAAMLTATVYLAEQWRKHGAVAIYRALLRKVADGKLSLKDAFRRFRFTASAEAGGEQVERLRRISPQQQRDEIDSSDLSIFEDLTTDAELSSDTETHARKEPERAAKRTGVPLARNRRKRNFESTNILNEDAGFKFHALRSKRYDNAVTNAVASKKRKRASITTSSNNNNNNTAASDADIADTQFAAQIGAKPAKLPRIDLVEQADYDRAIRESMIEDDSSNANVNRSPNRQDDDQDDDEGGDLLQIQDDDEWGDLQIEEDQMGGGSDS